MAIPAMALLQQHDAQRDILIEPAARRHAAIEARGRSELGAQSSCKNQPACCYWLCSTQLSPKNSEVLTSAIVLAASFFHSLPDS